MSFLQPVRPPVRLANSKTIKVGDLFTFINPADEHSFRVFEMVELGFITFGGDAVNGTVHLVTWIGRNEIEMVYPWDEQTLQEYT